MDILKIVFIGILTALLYSLMRQMKPEFAPLVAVGGAAVTLITLTEKLLELSGGVGEIVSLAGIESENVSVLMKALAICVVTQFAADICYDNSCSSVAGAVELAGRIGAIAVSLPMLKAAAQLAIGLING